MTPQLHRVCAHCQTEAGERPQPGQSHGICRRHYEQELSAAGFNRAQIDASLTRRPEARFCPDLANQQEAVC